MRRGALTFEQACMLQREAESLLSGLEFEVDSLGVLELVRDSDCSAYDCEFVALAVQLETKLGAALLERRYQAGIRISGLRNLST
jgi:hypothetical protein